MAAWSRFDRDPELAAFVRERAAQGTIREISAEMVAAFPKRKLPSRSTLARFMATERERQGFRLGSSGRAKPPPAKLLQFPAAFAADPDLTLMVCRLAGHMPLEAMLAACKATFPEHDVTRSNLAEAVTAELLARRHQAKLLRSRRTG